jgi:hypothetical protein
MSQFFFIALWDARFCGRLHYAAFESVYRTILRLILGQQRNFAKPLAEVLIFQKCNFSSKAAGNIDGLNCG